MEKTILCIEDNYHNRRLVQKALSARGYGVFLAEDGVSGWQMVQEIRPSLVLLDISLPGKDGLEIVSLMKADEALKNTWVIALTASAMTGDRERFLAAGCDDYLSKPIQIKELLEQVERFFDSREVRGAAEGDGGFR
jgi:CheY-like chemotaxis protein